MNKCHYHTCNLNANVPHSNEFCIFHSQIDEKGVDEIQFLQHLVQYIKHTNSFNFVGFVFPLIEFNMVLKLSGKTSFDAVANFSESRFEGSSIQKTNGHTFEFGCFFKEVVFNDIVNFEAAEFINGAGVFSDAKFNGNKTNFKNTKFLKGAYFDKAIFKSQIVDFSNVEFRNNETIFSNSKYEGFNHLNFNNSTFTSGYVELNQMTFDGRDITFDNSIFDSDKVHIENNNFKTSILSFKNSTIKGKQFFFKENKIETMVFSFANTKFLAENIAFAHITINKTKKTYGNRTIFDGSEFANGNTSFANISFSCGSASFKEAKFESDVLFIENEYKDGATFESAVFGKKNSNDISDSTKVVSPIEIRFLYNRLYREMDFANILLSDNLLLAFANLEFYDESAFYFTKPKLLNNEKNKKNIVVSFERINFKPYKTVFENIGNEFEEILKTFSIAFLIRYCDLQKVFFTNCQMSLFSFYKSIFHEAIVVSSRWSNERLSYFKVIKYDRNNILFEDAYYTYNEKNKDVILAKEKYQFEDFDSRLYIANMYRDLKVALDNTKDYQQAGYFYFNEFEMLRLHYSKEKGLKAKSKYFLYTTYKYLAGYGEKPLWSFIWLVFTTLLLSMLNLLIGFKFRSSEINYDFYKESNVMYSIN